MNTKYSQHIFQQPQQNIQYFEINYLDIDQYFAPNSSTDCTEEKEQIFESPTRKISNLFEEGFQVIPFQPIYRQQSIHETQLFSQVEQATPIQIETKQQEKIAPPSVAYKNVCYNICQKAIKVIQKDTYGNKLSQICQEHSLSKETFIRQIVKVKKNFTGPKAFEQYISQKGQTNKIFKTFMRWFLQQKYLRHCLTGDMLNKQAYIKFKNEYMLVVLG